MRQLLTDSLGFGQQGETVLARRARQIMATAAAAALVAIGVTTGATSAHAVTDDGFVSVSSRSNSVTVRPDGAYAYVSDFIARNLIVIDTDTRASTIIDMPHGWQPRMMAFAPNGTDLWVATTRGLLIVDTTTNTVGDHLSAVDSYELEFSADGARAYVLTSNGVVQVYDVATRSLLTEIDLPGEPANLAVSRDETRIYVADVSVQEVAEYDLAGTRLRAHTFSYPMRLAWNADQSTLFVEATNSQIAAIGIADWSVVGPIPLSRALGAVILSPDGSELILGSRTAGQLEFRDPLTLEVRQTLDLGVSADSISFFDNGARAAALDIDTARLHFLAFGELPTVTATVPATAASGTPFSGRIAAEGDPVPVISVSAGALPAGIVLNATTGALSGTPTKPGVHAFTITATNRYGSASVDLTIEVTGAELAATGTDAALPLASALALIGAGAVLLLRRRAAGRSAS